MEKSKLQNTNAAKPKKCKVCSTSFQPFSTLQKVCGQITCAIEQGRLDKAKNQPRLERARRNNERKELSTAREGAKTLKTLCAEARVIAQAYARARDLAAGYRTCICCGTGAIEHGCHLYAVGSKYQNSRFSLDARQIHGGCIHCNVYVGGGNRPGFEAGLVARYGQGFLSELAELKRKADHGEDLPLSKQEVVAIKADYREKLKALKAAHV